MKTWKMLAVVACCLVGSARADDMVESAQYKAWKDFKPGASVTMTMDMEMGAMKMSSKMTHVLKEVTAENVTIEQSAEMNGQKMPATPATHPKMVKKGNEYLPEGMEGKAEVTGKESVTVSGKAYECEVVSFEGTQAGTKMTGKIFRSAELPGGIAKMELNATTPQGEMKVMSVVSEFDAKK